MSYGIRYTGKCYSEQDDVIDVNIYQQDYAGSSSALELNKVKVEYSGDGDGLFDTVLQGSMCEVGVSVTRGTAFDTFLNGLIGSESELLIEIIRNGQREWVGKVLIDTVEREDAPFYTYTFTGTCGLAQLKDFDFDYALNNSNPFTVILGEMLRLALQPTLSNELYDATDNYIASTLNVYNTNQQGWVSTRCPLQINRINRYALIADRAKDKPLTCAEVVERILTPFGARIRMQNGCWHIIKPDAFTETAPRIFYYGNRDYANGALSTTTLNHLVNHGSGVRTEAGNTETYKPALIRVDVDWKPKSGTGIIKALNTNTTFPFTDVANLDDYPLRLSGKVRFSVPRIIQNGRSVVNGVVQLQMQIKAQNGNTAVYALDYNNTQKFYWSNNLQSYVYYTFAQVTDGRLYDEQEISIDIPILVDTQINKLQFSIAVVNKTPICISNVEWSCALELAQQFPNGTYKNDIAYQSTNNLLTNNSVYKQREIFIGDTTNSFVDARIVSQNSTSNNWEPSTVWNISYDNTNFYPIGQLLSRTMMQLQRTANSTYQGNFIFTSVYGPIKTIGYDGKTYFFNSGEFDYMTATVNGDWIALNRITTNITEATDVPRFSELDELRNDIRDLRGLIGGLTGSVGDNTININNLTQQLLNFSNLASALQPNIAGIVELPEGYVAGTALPINLSVDADGNASYTVGP